ncbi:MAG: hypothetical protein HY070_02840 [Chloroflexi bacterium]|nr:hypothetical protein [Chloroflexota bacterium]MBI3742035.1 hypothetical protein [Chloroflexota bacterium]
MKIQKLLSIVFACLFVILIAGCQAQILSETFSNTSKVTKDWVNACIREDAIAAAKYWSKSDPEQAKNQSELLCDLHKRAKFELVSVEDRGSLISSGRLSVFLRRGDGKTGEMVVSLANSDNSVVIIRVEFQYGQVGSQYESNFWR